MLSKSNLFSYADIGDWFPYFGATLPAGFLWCDGRSLSRTDPLYAPLFAKISTRFGAVDGSSFNIPDTRGSVLANTGQAEAVGAIPAYQISATFNTFAGTATSTLTGTPAHSHSQSASHTHAGGGFNATHTHWGQYANHTGSRSDVIYEANTATQGYYTATYYAFPTANDGTLTSVTPAPAINNTTTGVSIGAPQVSGVNHTGVTTPHENMMPWMATPFIIKYAY